MTCSTCRNFRQGVVARVGYCAMDRTREPLNGDEIRACWQAPAEGEAPAGLFAALDPGADEKPLGIVETARQLVEVERAADGGETVAVGAAGPAPGTAGIAPRSSGASPRTLAAGSPAPETALPPATTDVPPPRPTGRLLEAPVVAPRLRLGSRGDARSARDAAGVVPAGAPSPSANGEGDRLLEGGPIL